MPASTSPSGLISADLRTLLTAVNSDPWDNLPRLALADCLEEQSNLRRAQFIRWQLDKEEGWRRECNLMCDRPWNGNGLEPQCWKFTSGPYAALLNDREDDLYQYADAVLPVPQYGVARACVWRGFVEWVEYHVRDFMACARQLFLNSPLLGVTLTGMLPHHYEGKYYWFEERAENETTRLHFLPSVLFGCVVDAGYEYDYAEAESNLVSKAEAMNVLSLGCVLYGRRLAGLPPLPYTDEEEPGV